MRRRRGTVQGNFRAQPGLAKPVTIRRAAYRTFIDKNADALWKDARGPNFQLSERWSGPFDSGNAASQTSALDALVGAAVIRSKAKAHGSVGELQYELTIDATNQEQPSAGRGPFPGSALPGHSVGLPIRLDLVASEKLEANGTMPIDFILTNIGAEPIKLPISVDGNSYSQRETLTLYLTSDGIDFGHFVSGDPIFPFQPTSAGLSAVSGDPKTFYLFAPGKAIRVRASMGFRMKPGMHSLTGHAELSREVVTPSGVGAEVLGTAESITVEKTFSPPRPAIR